MKIEPQDAFQITGNPPDYNTTVLIPVRLITAGKGKYVVRYPRGCNSPHAGNLHEHTMAPNMILGADGTDLCTGKPGNRAFVALLPKKPAVQSEKHEPKAFDPFDL